MGKPAKTETAYRRKLKALRDQVPRSSAAVFVTIRAARCQRSAAVINFFASIKTPAVASRSWIVRSLEAERCIGATRDRPYFRRLYLGGQPSF